MSVNYSKPKLVSFYIFDNRNGQKEGEEHEKLLFYSPSDEQLNTKVRNVGLSEAFTRFTSMFNNSSDCETVHSQKHVTALIQPEPFIWMVLKVALAHTCRRAEQPVPKKSKKSLKNSSKSINKSKPVSISVQGQSSNDPTLTSDDGGRRGSQQTSTGNLTVDYPQNDSSNNSPKNDSTDRTSVTSSVSNASSGEALDASRNPTSPNYSVGHKDETENSISKPQPNESSDTIRRENYDSTSTVSSVVNGNKSSDAENSVASSSRAAKEDNDSMGSQTDVHSSSILSAQFKNCVAKDSTSQNACTNPDCASSVQYISSSVQPSVLHAHLQAAYSSFALLHHSFGMVLQLLGLEKLRHVLQLFFNDYLGKVDMSHGDLSSVWRGLSYMPLSQSLLLRVRCCLASLRSALPVIRATAFLYSGSIAWCDFSLETLRRLLHYLHYNGVLKQVALQATQEDASYANRFIGGVGHSIRAYIGEDGRMGVAGRRSECHLLLYSCAGTIIPLVVPVTERLEPILYEKLARLLDSRVKQLVTDIKASKPSKSTPNPSDNFNYVYHNSMNLAVKSTLRVEKPPEQSHTVDSGTSGGSKGSWWFTGNKITETEDSGSVVESGAFGLGGGVVLVTSSQGPSVIPWKVMLTIVDLQADMQRYGHHESVLKTVDDHWVVGRTGNGRQLFVTLANSTSNLVEITDEVQRIAQLHFSDIFMME
ncbi:hypothetical protein FHG87_002023 [Trinorchestia longiramus]|nr:hypothetical protein FHG87_002023 [Trinorchestia longiramus]